MRQLSRVRVWCEAVFVAGCAAMVLLLHAAHLSYIIEDPFTFAVLAGGVMLGEMLPVKIPAAARTRRSPSRPRSRWRCCSPADSGRR